MNQIGKIEMPPIEGALPRAPGQQPEYDVTKTGLCGIMQTRHGREVAPELKFQIEFEMLKELDWKERVQLVFGCNMKIKGSIMCRHNPGVAAPAVVAWVCAEELRRRSWVMSQLDRWIDWVHPKWLHLVVKIDKFCVKHFSKKKKNETPAPNGKSE